MASVLEIENRIERTWDRHVVLRVCVCVCVTCYFSYCRCKSHTHTHTPDENEREIQRKQKLKDMSFEQWGSISRSIFTNSVQFSSVAQSCPTLCDSMNHSTPGLLVHHQLPKITQTHVHWVGDAIQPSHPLSSPSPPAPNLS